MVSDLTNVIATARRRCSETDIDVIQGVSHGTHSFTVAIMFISVEETGFTGRAGDAEGTAFLGEVEMACGS
jgi:hypothetical protein